MQIFECFDFNGVSSIYIFNNLVSALGLNLVQQCTMAQALNKFEFKDFAKMIPSALIFPLSLSNSLSFA